MRHFDVCVVAANDTLLRSTAMSIDFSAVSADALANRRGDSLRHDCGLRYAAQTAAMLSGAMVLLAAGRARFCFLGLPPPYSPRVTVNGGTGMAAELFRLGFRHLFAFANLNHLAALLAIIRVAVVRFECAVSLDLAAGDSAFLPMIHKNNSLLFLYHAG